MDVKHLIELKCAKLLLGLRVARVLYSTRIHCLTIIKFDWLNHEVRQGLRYSTTIIRVDIDIIDQLSSGIGLTTIDVLIDMLKMKTWF